VNSNACACIEARIIAASAQLEAQLGKPLTDDLLSTVACALDEVKRALNTFKLLGRLVRRRCNLLFSGCWR